MKKEINKSKKLKPISVSKPKQAKSAVINPLKVKDLIQDDKNFNKGTKQGKALIKKSFKNFGTGRSILLDKNNRIIAGNKSVENAEEIGIEDLIIVESDGSKLIAVKRTDIDLDTKKGRYMALADNATAKANIFFDAEIINAEISQEVQAEWAINIDVNNRDVQNSLSESILVSKLKFHPRSYREHPEDQINDLVKSVEANGVFRNVVIANDNTILDGKALVIAARIIGLKHLNITRLNIDSNSQEALKILITNNELTKSAEVDDRKLSEILKELKQSIGLSGTGYDDMKLANLLMVTRPAGEIKNLNQALEWVGMPDYEATIDPLKLTVSFENEKDKAAFFKLVKQKYTEKTKSVWFPYKERDDTISVKYDNSKKKVTIKKIVPAKKKNNL